MNVVKMRTWWCFGYLVWCVFFVQSCCGQEPSLVIEPHGKQSQAADKQFVLTCKGVPDKSNAFKQMKFFGPHGEISNNQQNRVYTQIIANSLYLIFNPTSFEDTGSYNCTSLYYDTESMLATVEIVIFKDITWESCDAKQSVIVDKDGKVKCRVSANPQAIVTWMKDGIQIVGDRYITEEDGVKILNVNKEDQGKYHVRALVTQTGSLLTREIEVFVYEPPVINEFKDYVEIIEEENAHLDCQATGNPPPRYFWYHDDKRDLSQVDGYHVSPEGTLTINKVRLEDKGKYTCKALNDAGEVEKDISVVVIAKPRIIEFNNETKDLGQDIQLRCKATGSPLPELKIRKEGEEHPISFSHNSRYDVTVSEDNGVNILTLTISQLNRSDDGLYYCSASNKGAHVEQVGHLTVQFGPDTTRTVREFVTWNERPVNLTCIAEAIPNATISWIFRSLLLPNTNQKYKVHGTTSISHLEIHPGRDNNVQDSVYGTYSCEAQNPLGKTSVSINLKEATAPAAIYQSPIIQQTPSSLTFQIEGPSNDGGLPVEAYVIQYWVTGQENNPVTKEWTNGPYVLINLVPRNTYYYRISAKNQVGQSEWSPTSHFQMPQESFPDIPVIKPVENNESPFSDRITLEWIDPADNGRQIKAFKVRYFRVDQVKDDWRQLGEAVEETVTDWKKYGGSKHTITNLWPNTYYKIELRAANDIGNSQDASVIMRTSSASNEHGAITGGDTGESSIPVAIIIAVVAVLVVIILIVLDVTCYLKYRWGLSYVIRRSICGTSSPREKVDNVSDDDNKPNKEKQPLHSADVIRTCGPTYGDLTREDEPMISSNGGKDSKHNFNNIDDGLQNKSPKGSKSSIAKDSPV